MQDQSAPSTMLTARVVAISAAIFVAFYCLYGMTSEHLSHLAFNHNDAFFDADTYDTTRAMEKLTFGFDMRKHLLFSPVTSTLARAVDVVSGIGIRPSILVTIAGLAAANIVLCFLLLRVVLRDELAALAYAVLYGVTLANLVIFSLPETYSVSNLFILGYLAYLCPRWRTLSVRDGTLLAVVAGLASLANPPLLALVAIHTFITWRREGPRFAVRMGIIWSLLATLIYFISAIAIGGWVGLRFPAAYLHQWVSVGNFIDWQSIVHVVASFLVFAVITPVSVVEGNLEPGDILGYGATLSGLITALAWTAVLATAIVRSVRGDNLLLEALLVWIALSAVFYLFFHPPGAILYSPQFLIPWMLVVATQGMQMFGRWNWTLAVVLAVLCGYQNLQAVLAAPTT